MRKAWNILTTILTALVVLAALFFVGARIAGLRVYAVLSGSMEPEYPVGSLIFVKAADPEAIREGDVITFRLSETLTATHRVIGVERGEDGALNFQTKGDANAAADARPVHEKNVVGRPVFKIPYLGYFASMVQNPPIRFALLTVAALILLLPFVQRLARGAHEN